MTTTTIRGAGMTTATLAADMIGTRRDGYRKVPWTWGATAWVGVCAIASAVLTVVHP